MLGYPGYSVPSWRGGFGRRPTWTPSTRGGALSTEARRRIAPAADKWRAVSLRPREGRIHTQGDLRACHLCALIKNDDNGGEDQYTSAD
eukprot:6379245-Pyramimonas_sp.AAC.1